MFVHWMKLSSDMMMANLQAQRVIGLRMMKLARGGPAAEIESRRMVSEKITAATDASIALATGKSPESVVRRYRAVMSANERRLNGGTKKGKSNVKRKK
jgi:hypothetical protein